MSGAYYTVVSVLPEAASVGAPPAHGPSGGVCTGRRRARVACSKA